MRLFEFSINTTDPDTLMRKIANDIQAGERRDCHGTCAGAIRKGEVDDSDLVLIVGPKGAKGKVGYHSLIMDRSGNIKVDSFSHKMVDYDKEEGIFYYDLGGSKPMPMTYKTFASVGDLKQM